MTVRSFLFILFLAAGAINASAQTREEYLKAYTLRANEIRHTFDTSTAVSYYGIAARYSSGNGIAVADSLFQVALREPRGDMFWMFPVIGAYLHGKDVMSAPTRAAVRNAWKTYAPYRGDTENHWAMYYSTLFLAAEQWPGLPGSEWFNGKSSRENFDDAREYLIHWMKITTTIGQGEFDSPDYFPEYGISMCLLAQFAQDPEMKKRGQMMYDYVLADFAAEHLDGQYLGGFSRIYQPAVFKPLQSQVSGFAWLYFGTGEAQDTSAGHLQPTPKARPPGESPYSGWHLLPALSDYRLPEIICHIATDRSMPYLHKERKRVRNVIRFGTEKNPPVYKQTYVTADYGIGALQGGLLQPIQQHTWSVRFTSGRPYTTIFGLHPYWSSLELGMFFPEELKPLIADVVASKGTYNNPDKWTGGSPFERTFQDRNTIIVLYDIPAGTMTEHIDGFFPGTLDERKNDPSGWIVCKAGNTFIGWYPLQATEWIAENDPAGQVKNVIGRPENTRDQQQGFINWRLRSHQLQNGYVVEVRSAREIGSFENFVTELRAHVPKASLVPGKVSVDYTSLNKSRMSFAFPEVRKLNGKPVDLTTYRLFDGPFMHADVGSEKLTMTWKGMTRILDFTTVTITDK
jgi:hypothetical protein